jgi:hypothetical protein
MDAGDDPDKFTVEITHNGFFYGLHEQMHYVEVTVDCFDNCNIDTWSIF